MTDSRLKNLGAFFHDSNEMIPPSTRLRRALALRSLPLVTRILTSHPLDDVLLRNADYSDEATTSLHLCALYGLPDIASYLLSLGHEDAGISRTTAGITPLMLACQAGSEDDNPHIPSRIAVGKLLIERFPEHVTIRDKQGMDAFAHAAAHGTNPLLTLLLSKPLDPFAQKAMQDRVYNVLSGASDDEEDHGTSLRFISSRSTSNPPAAAAAAAPVPPEFAQQLSQMNSTTVHPLIGTRDNNNNTPLHHASASGHLKTLRLLISSGADAQARNAFTWTAVDYSATVAAEVYLRQLVKEQLQKQGIATGRQSPTTGRSSPAERWGNAAAGVGTPVGMSSPGGVAFGSPGLSSPGGGFGSPVGGRQSPVATAAQIAERGMGRMRGGSNETGRSSPVPTTLAGRLRGESDEKRRPGVRLVQSEASESDAESDEAVGTVANRARTRS